ncbi:hypothetical protein MOPEL_130_00050 [Mobilicoccus pelagius NBRC 104925]|uniref:Uncharacterized protein n=1 Tax=Mobilicoccus pelagius NBRC 104925 TaxID=1089455 RepID=H5UUJ0_9MICO|nr:hypothetical protein MOPEL_130_00050 [Mobilicoccus pelagius NBRC 104925]
MRRRDGRGREVGGRDAGVRTGAPAPREMGCRQGNGGVVRVYRDMEMSVPAEWSRVGVGGLPPTVTASA